MILSPPEVVGAVIEYGKAKAEKPFSVLLILGILAGAFIGLAAQGSTMAGFNLISNPETYGVGRCLIGAVFSIGLMLVLLSGAELFTGNTLIIVSAVEKRTTVGKMLKNWVIVYLANFLGAFLIVIMISQTGLLAGGEGLLGEITVKIAIGKVNMSFFGVLCSGIMCNWLVCCAVWMSYSTNSLGAKIAAIFFPIWLFVTSGFEHSVANMYYIPAGILAKAQYGAAFSQEQLASLNWGNFVTANLLPATLGNIIGGCVFVGIACWYVFYKNRVGVPKKRTSGN